MNQLQIFLPCAAGVEDYLAAEAQAITSLPDQAVQKWRGGVLINGSWRAMLLLNLHCRLAQRVLVQLSYTPYRSEQDLYRAASEVAWEIWFTPKQSIKVEVTAQHRSFSGKSPRRTPRCQHPVAGCSNLRPPHHRQLLAVYRYLWRTPV